jgi:hypothetical protein
MAQSIYDTVSLVGLVPNLMTSQNWLLDRFFPNIETSNDEYVAIDVDVGLRRMAPFCSPLVEGKLVESRRYQTDKFKPAYIKDKRAPDLRKPIRRQIGERIGGEYTAAEREMLNIQFEMSDQIDVLNRRLEWMGASALSTGTVTIKGRVPHHCGGFWSRSGADSGPERLGQMADESCRRRDQHPAV